MLVQHSGEVKPLLEHALSVVAGTVATTLGPHGNTVALQQTPHEEFRLTKDGVTVANAVQLRGPERVVSQLM